MDWRVTGEVPEDEYVLPIGVGDVKRVGEDVTLVGTSSMVHVCLAAAELLAADGISAEVLDPRTLSEWVLADRLSVRVQLQLHKFIWSPTTRGV